MLDIWKTVQLRQRKSAAAYLTALKDKGIVIGEVAEEVILRTPMSFRETTVGLVRAAAADLELTDGSPLPALYNPALKLGLKLCTVETALALREEYQDQPEGEILWIAMGPIIASDSTSGVLCLGHDRRGKWLTFGCGSGCAWGRWRRRNFSPLTQTIIVPMRICECPWSRSPVVAIFEKDLS